VTLTLPSGRAQFLMLSLQQLSLSYAPAAALTTPRTARAVPQMANTAEDLETLAKELNPVVGYWDPLGIGKIAKSIDADEQATIGWWRHAEIKHGRVAMAAFVGFCVQSNGIVLPGQLTTSGITYADIAAAGGPGDQWDALPTWAKVQIICAVGFLEAIGELSPVIEANGEKHYVKGGKPGYYPPFSGFFNEQYWPHPLPLNLYDPFGFSKNASPEKKAKGLRAEINNGRLAMLGTPAPLSQPYPATPFTLHPSPSRNPTPPTPPLTLGSKPPPERFHSHCVFPGIFGFVSQSKVPHSVPGLETIDIKPYAGEYMGPFVAGDVSLPFVQDMLNMAPKFPF
jgi:hypothetical protein